MSNQQRLLLRVALAIAGVLLIVGVTAAWVVRDYLLRVESSLPEVSKLDDYEPSLPTVILSRDGVKIGELFDEKRYPVLLKDVNPQLVKAFLAAEDARFYEHDGVDMHGILRAGVHFLTKSGTKQGGSTITQQLAKNLLLTKERTLERKVKDIMLARKIERSFSKEKILELYLNTIFLGNNSYGIEAAARNYFRKTNKDLSLAEAAMIAGLTPAPSAYAPTENLEKAKTRQRFVLEQMIKNKWAVEAEANKAFKQKLKIYRAESPNTQAAPHFLMEVKKQLEKQLKLEKITSNGYIVSTTLDMRLQRDAQEKVISYLKAHESKKGYKGALKRHGKGLEAGLTRMLNLPFNPDEEDERAMVVDLLPHLDAALIVSQQGFGLLLTEDHRWALRVVGKTRETSLMDFANVLAIGDEVHVKRLERQAPKRVDRQNTALMSLLNNYRPFYKVTQPRTELRFYQLTDTEGVEAAALVMNSHTGEVLAMVGGSDYAGSNFNRATQAKRQVGSSVKPLYYALAQDKGFSPASQIDSPPIVIGDWKPENYSKEFMGRTTLRTSLIHSYNIPSIQIFQALGMQTCSKHFRSLGLDWPEGDLSLALGSGEATLLQMTQAYSPFANAGKIAEAVYISRIENRHGKVIYEEGSPSLRVQPVSQLHASRSGSSQGAKDVALHAKNKNSGTLANSKTNLQVLSPEAAYVTVQMMQDVVRFGTGTRAAGVPFAAGKTGTTNGYSDAWFMGVVPSLVGGVWVGFDDSRKSLGASEGTGGKMAAPLWQAIMLSATKLYPQQAWREPDGITHVRIDPETGHLALGGGGLSISAVEGTQPGAPGARNALGLSAFDSDASGRSSDGSGASGGAANGADGGDTTASPSSSSSQPSGESDSNALRSMF